MVDAEGNDAGDDPRAKRDAQLELANTLWLSKLLQTKAPPLLKENSKQGSAAATAGKDKGIKRKTPTMAAGAERADVGSNAPSPAQPLKKKKQQHSAGGKLQGRKL
jgi:hypothetical protein